MYSGSVLLSWLFLVPAGELAVLWCVEPIGVAVAATIDEGSALATSSVVVPPQGVPGTVSLVQGKQARVLYGGFSSKSFLDGRVCGVYFIAIRIIIVLLMGNL